MKQKQSRFPMSLFFVYFFVLLLMSGIHTGLVTLMNHKNMPTLIEISVPLLYWVAIACGLTVFTRWRIRLTYDDPMTELAGAAKQVASGDFSVYNEEAKTRRKN